MHILTVESLHKQYGERILFHELSFGLEAGERVGLIGVNGSGKSTLLKIIAGIEPPDAGRVVLRSGVRVAYLPQNPELPDEQRVLDFVYGGNAEALELLQRYEFVSRRLAEVPQDAALLGELADLGERVAAVGAWDLERNAKTILSQLGVVDFNALLGNLSGGQRKRAALARVLIDRADLLILDEPTNHIDPDTVAWLEGYLAVAPGALLLITHDRYFLDRVTNRILELERSELYSHAGNYQSFLEARAERETQAEREALARRNEIRRELAWLRRGARARTTKQKAHVERATALINQQVEAGPGTLELDVAGRRIGKRVIELKQLAKRFGERQVIKNLSYEVARDDRMGIIGPNGSGKSTLLNLIAGRLQPDAGEVLIGETIHIAYYDQTSSDLDESQRLIDYISDAARVIATPDGGTITAGQMLERFLFPTTQHYAAIATLSGGERRRLYLLRRLMQNPNVLLLDEPTNDLDVQTLAVLEDYLESFPGAVIVVSHDRAFLDNVVDHLLVFDGNGGIRHYPGGYSEYRAAKAREEAATESAARAAVEAARAPAQEQRRERPRKLSFKEQRELAELEERIAALEEQQSQLAAAINNAGSDYQLFERLAQELAGVEATLEAAVERWSVLAEIAASQ